MVLMCFGHRFKRLVLTLSTRHIKLIHFSFNIPPVEPTTNELIINISQMKKLPEAMQNQIKFSMTGS